jgi:hypothetical protein
MENFIEIYFDDLSETKKEEMLAKLGNNANYDIYPIAVIAVNSEDEEEK